MTIAAIPTPPAVELKIHKCPGDLPEADLIRQFISVGGLDPEIGEEEAADHIVWKFPAAQGFSTILTLYRDAGGEMFVWFEVAVAKIPQPQEAEINQFLLRYQADFFFPIRLAVNEQKYVIVQFRSFLAGLSRDGFSTRLNTLIPIAQRVFDELQQRFGLQPLYDTEDDAQAGQ